MAKTKILNLIDMFKLKKDLLWGKYYYGLLDQGNLVDSILFSHAYSNPELVEIHHIESRMPELLNDFVDQFARRKKIRYFLRELDELNQVSDIEFMNSCGFQRYDRLYYYEYDANVHTEAERTQFQVFCREAYEDDLEKLVEHDREAQILEYRDALYRPVNFFKDHLVNVYVFCNAQKPEQICAYCIKKEASLSDTFEFVIHPRQATQTLNFIHAFAEKFVHFDQYSSKFRFVIDDEPNKIFHHEATNYPLISVSQLLIHEGKSREKARQLETIAVIARSSEAAT